MCAENPNMRPEASQILKKRVFGGKGLFGGEEMDHEIVKLLPAQEFATKGVDPLEPKNTTSVKTLPEH